ncbi:hypothetical protein E3N88_21748 [Mikania micrantha]|uniref:Uncharacterized protein n=1 Tax=Mikania micrantha TaxID=192012 RepID=A0A5N6NA10_9ASTR|nr:hypothetical protein E3N88_21748 [Mikania micrantha]
MQGVTTNEPDVAEFILAIAAENNAQLMVIVCADTSDLTTSGLIAAFHQTDGRLVYIVNGEEQIQTSNQFLNSESNYVEFVVGNAEFLLSNEFKSADFVVIDCNLQNHERILEAIQSEREKGTIVLGYNAIWKDSWMWSKLDSRLLPIGEGLLLMRVAGKSGNGGGTSGGGRGRSNWVVRVDKYTGEEHVFRIKSPGGMVGM